jgi:hypothetical protein
MHCMVAVKQQPLLCCSSAINSCTIYVDLQVLIKRLLDEAPLPGTAVAASINAADRSQLFAAAFARPLHS